MSAVPRAEGRHREPLLATATVRAVQLWWKAPKHQEHHDDETTSSRRYRDTRRHTSTKPRQGYEAPHHHEALQAPRGYQRR